MTTEARLRQFVLMHGGPRLDTTWQVERYVCTCGTWAYAIHEPGKDPASGIQHMHDCLWLEVHQSDFADCDGVDNPNAWAL